ncbi:MAG: MurT ligase domain-containing protein [Bacillota bacterium]
MVLNLLGRIRFLLGIWLGKVVAAVSRALGKGGSTLPGKLCLCVCPTALGQLSLSLNHGRVLVTGTNGKTTTSRVLENLLKQAGYSVVHNRSGANLISGVTASLVTASDLLGRPGADVGVFETDEASVPGIAKQMCPSAVVVTNFFRDQLDRFGELEHTVELVRAGVEYLAEGGALVLNADDPLCASIGARSSGSLRTFYYGIDPGFEGTFLRGRATCSDVFVCPLCGGKLEYSSRFFSHLGNYKCSVCGFSRPSAFCTLVKLETLGIQGSTMHIRISSGEEFAVETQLPGIYNAYNVLAGVTAACAFGLPLAVIQAGVKQSLPSFGRMERVVADGKRIHIALVKNPTGFNEVLRTVVEGAGPHHLMICINDNYADGTDVSWLWDVDLEMLEPRQSLIPFVVCSGIRAADMAVRLKYAGIDPSRIVVEPGIKAALDMAMAKVPAGESLVVLPTYTAMLELREVLWRRGLVRHFRED